MERDCSLEKCKSETKKGMYEEDTPENVDAIFNELGKTTDEIALCACEILEGKYSSFSEADNDAIMMSDEEIGELILPCIIDVRENMDSSVEANTDNGWDQFTVDVFMQGCAADQAMEGYCSCILEELMQKYTWEEANMITEEDIMNLETFDDCLELISH